jgi:hypothetical protein
VVLMASLNQVIQLYASIVFGPGAFAALIHPRGWPALFALLSISGAAE